MTFADLSQTLDAAREQIRIDRVELTDDARSMLFDHFAFGGIPYNTVSRVSVPVATLKGKPTRKWFHVIVSRLDNGRYELVSYAN